MVLYDMVVVQNCDVLDISLTQFSYIHRNSSTKKNLGVAHPVLGFTEAYSKPCQTKQ